MQGCSTVSSPGCLLAVGREATGNIAAGWGVAEVWHRMHCEQHGVAQVSDCNSRRSAQESVRAVEWSFMNGVGLGRDTECKGMPCVFRGSRTAGVGGGPRCWERAATELGLEALVQAGQGWDVMLVALCLARGASPSSVGTWGCWEFTEDGR